MSLRPPRAPPSRLEIALAAGLRALDISLIAGAGRSARYSTDANLTTAAVPLLTAAFDSSKGSITRAAACTCRELSVDFFADLATLLLPATRRDASSSAMPLAMHSALREMPSSGCFDLRILPMYLRRKHKQGVGLSRCAAVSRPKGCAQVVGRHRLRALAGRHR